MEDGGREGCVVRATRSTVTVVSSRAGFRLRWEDSREGGPNLVI